MDMTATKLRACNRGPGEGSDPKHREGPGKGMTLNTGKGLWCFEMCACSCRKDGRYPPLLNCHARQAAAWTRARARGRAAGRLLDPLLSYACLEEE